MLDFELNDATPCAGNVNSLIELLVMKYVCGVVSGVPSGLL
jgi:hypothetical protein